MKNFVVLPILLTLGFVFGSCQEFSPEANLTTKFSSNVTVDCTEDNISFIYEDARLCLNKYGDEEVPLPKGEFLPLLEQCTKQAIAKYEQCITDKDFLEFLSTFIKSVVSFQYENYVLISMNLEDCLYNSTFSSKDEDTVWKCYDDIYEKTNNTYVGNPKVLFCNQTVSFVNCIRDVVMGNCDQTPELKKLGDEVVNAFKEPCGM